MKSKSEGEGELHFGRKFCLLNMTGRELNGTGKKFDAVELPPFFQCRLKKILDEETVLSFFDPFSTIEDVPELYDLRLCRKAEDFYNLMLLVMRSKIPVLRFKILVDGSRLPFDHFISIFKDYNMDSRVEVIKICFDNPDEEVIRPFGNIWKGVC